MPDDLFKKLPRFGKLKCFLSERFYNLSEENAANLSYDAYEKDIAMVQVNSIEIVSTLRRVYTILFLHAFFCIALGFSNNYVC